MCLRVHAIETPSRVCCRRHPGLAPPALCPCRRHSHFCILLSSRSGRGLISTLCSYCCHEPEPTYFPFPAGGYNSATGVTSQFYLFIFFKPASIMSSTSAGSATFVVVLLSRQCTQSRLKPSSCFWCHSGNVQPFSLLK